MDLAHLTITEAPALIVVAVGALAAGAAYLFRR